MKEKKCENCKHCIYSSLGEYTCDATIPMRIIENDEPNENYGYCGNLGFEDKEEEEE